MELFIRLKNGQPFEHPILGDNFREAFPHVDLSIPLPDWVARFTRVPMPTIGVYEVYEKTTYEWDGVGYTDVHYVRSMTDLERVAKQEQAKTVWAQNGLLSWVFDEATCAFNPPIPYPQDGKNYRWDEPTVSWIQIQE